ncbi:MAG: pitrilysin family protein [Muribaculaceae bacterium]
MIDIHCHTLSNGLKIVHHKDATTQMVALNLLYDVGSRDEEVGRTGLAHLFEHLMFGGSKNIPNFDSPLQAAGGESNAWTSDDVTNFYDVVPLHNVETAFWLESDRLNQLAFTDKSLETQRSVVIEEFKQRCLNQPYGDVEHIMRATAYTKHSYQWPVIGRNIKEIEDVKKESVKEFFYSHYAPNNLILSVVGNIEFDDVLRLSEKWFGSIERRNISPKNIPVEPMQSEARRISEKRDVPQNIIYKSYHMCSRYDDDYQTADLISDILANGHSSRFYRNLLMRGDIFTEIDASVWGSLDPGLMLVKGRLQEGVAFEQAEEIINEELQKIIKDSISKHEIEKCVNKFESKELFGNLSYLEKASNLGYYELIGGAEMINDEVSKYRHITPQMVNRVATSIFSEDNCTTLYYGKDV